MSWFNSETGAPQPFGANLLSSLKKVASQIDLFTMLKRIYWSINLNRLHRFHWFSFMFRFIIWYDVTWHHYSLIITLHINDGQGFIFFKSNHRTQTLIRVQTFLNHPPLSSLGKSMFDVLSFFWVQCFRVPIHFHFYPARLSTSFAAFVAHRHHSKSPAIFDFRRGSRFSSNVCIALLPTWSKWIL